MGNTPEGARKSWEDPVVREARERGMRLAKPRRLAMAAAVPGLDKTKFDALVALAQRYAEAATAYDEGWKRLTDCEKLVNNLPADSRSMFRAMLRFMPSKQTQRLQSKRGAFEVSHD